MRHWAIGLGLAAGLWGAAAQSAAWAQADVGEVVVTAERRAGPLQTYGGAPAVAQAPPHVVVFHRADNLIIAAQVECDTRDYKERLAEMRATLHNMIAAAAASGQIELGVEADNIVVPLKPDALDTLLSPGDRDDTTATTIVVKTHVTAADTFEAASARIDRFIQQTKVEGRTQVKRYGEWQLTLVTPRQYRPQVIAAIAADAGETVKAFGPGYGVELEGLERPIAWNRSGPLDLALYIPYALKVEPIPAR